MALVDDLTETIGAQNTIEMVRGWGGRRISVPSTIPDDHPITLKIGRRAADTLAFHYGGAQLDLPVERSALVDQRNSLICDRLANGKSARDVAEEFGLTARHVRFIWARAADDG